MRTRRLLYTFSVSALMIAACRKPYTPEAVAASANYLVVEGMINTQDTTTIKLSRTVNLSGNVSASPESGAVLTVESDQQTTFPLQETGGGLYKLPPQSLDISRKYRLRIKTSDGKEYLSDFEQAAMAPPIDSV